MYPFEVVIFILPSCCLFHFGKELMIKGCFGRDHIAACDSTNPHQEDPTSAPSWLSHPVAVDMEGTDRVHNLAIPLFLESLADWVFPTSKRCNPTDLLH
jgi:hypothetical protein